MFAYGGHGAFPTIQHDMRRPYHFNRSVMLAYISKCLFVEKLMKYLKNLFWHRFKKTGLLKKLSSFIFITVIVAMYLPVSIIGYEVYGDALRDSVIPAVQTKWIQQTANVLITLHVLLTLTIIFNPLTQDLEELFKLPQCIFKY